jgi:serine phosphatase RsbU (regulator of sigma subunit)
MKLKKYDDANHYISQSLSMLKSIGFKDGIKDAYSSLSDLFERQGDFKQAYNYRKLYSEMKDTLLNEQSSKQLTEMNSKYESEKKDKELIKKDAEITKQQTEAEKQIILRNAFIMGFTLVLVLAFFIYRGYRQKQKANKLLDEKNEKITDSINYAKRIQESILPPLEEIKKFLPASFVLYQPKDIVSGDFYWFHNPVPLESVSGEIFIAAVDCTGHGVPGAFMSMMGYNLLDQVVKKNHICQPAMVLNELSKLVVESLRQTEQLGKVNDGMDIAMIRLMVNNEKSASEKVNQKPLYDRLEYAGAHNSLYLIRNGILHETKADKASIGFSLEKSFCFTNHTISLEKDDCLYIFSDGFADQKGGPANEKFYYQPFRALLVEIHQLSMEEQEKKLQKVFSEWKGNRAQIDDMLVIGLKV